MSRLADRGDTIVEVLIAITVVSSVIGGAYVASSRSLNGSRSAQERGEALKLVEGQLERLKATGTDAAHPLYADTAFCFDSGGAYTATVPCQYSPLGVPYDLSITRVSNTFTVLASWDRVGGGSGEQLSITYKLYPR